MRGLWHRDPVTGRVLDLKFEATQDRQVVNTELTVFFLVLQKFSLFYFIIIIVVLCLCYHVMVK